MTIATATHPEVTHDDIYVTRELEHRASPESDHRQIKQALMELAGRMSEGPEAVLPLFVSLAMELGGGVSAGISIADLDASPPIFRWAFLKGSLAAFEGATTPRDFSPCGVTLDEDKAILTRHSELMYPWIADVNVVLPEVLLVPLHKGAEQLGTLWVVSDELSHFNKAHVDAITEVAAFVGVALRMHQTEVRLAKALEEQETLTREMSHRVKNVFNIVEGMIQLGGKRSASKEDLIKSLSGRVRALAVAHGMIRRTTTAVSDQTTDIGDLVRAILRPYEQARLDVSGPAAALGERTTNGLALVLHELATNAAKYGDLSRDGGTIEVTWAKGDASLILEWKERGGPLVSGAPSTAGFGSELVAGTVRQTLAGTLQHQWFPEGVEITLTMPVQQLDK